MAVCLDAESIEKRFPTPGDDLVVLRDVSMSLAKGESAVIMGPSGSGKSTLLNILGTLDSPTRGRITIEGCDPFELSPRDLARFRNRHIGFIFQDHHLLGQCSVLENVALPTLARMDGADRSEDPTARARALLDRVGLADRLDHRPAELSGGERQRVAIARALINRPSIVLADEPTGNLDRATAERIVSLLGDLHRDEGATLIAVTHSQVLAGRFERRFDMVDGTLMSHEVS